MIPPPSTGVVAAPMDSPRQQLSNPVLVPTPPPSTTPPPPLITECANAYSAVCFIITTSYAAVHVVFVQTSSMKMIKFYAWCITPLCVLSMGISFLLKPRRKDKPYLFFLYSQYFIFTFLAEILYLVGVNFRKREIWLSIGRSIFWFFIFFLCNRMRSRTSRLSDKRLSNFLAISVIKEGAMIGISQLLFLTFAPIQCDIGEEWRGAK